MKAFLCCLAVFVVASARAGVDCLIAFTSEPEARPLLEGMAGVQPHQVSGWSWWTGTWRGRSIAVVRLERDPLNAVAATTLALRATQPARVVVVTQGNALLPALKPGTWLQASAFSAFDGFVSGHRGLGEGTALKDWQPLLHPLIGKGEREIPTKAFAATPFLGASIPAHVFGSAHQVNQEADRLQWLRETWGIEVADTVSAHVAGTAQLFSVPCSGLMEITADDLLDPTKGDELAFGQRAVAKLSELLP